MVINKKMMRQLSISAGIKPQVVIGSFRRLFIWSDSFTSEIFTAASVASNSPDEDAFAKHLFSALNLAYSIVSVELLSGVITLIAGHNNFYPLYFRNDSGNLRIRDSLPCIDPDERLNYIDQNGFADFIARTVVTGPYEWSNHSVTFDRRWRIVPPGKRLKISADGNESGSETIDHLFQGIRDTTLQLAQGIENLRGSIDLHLISLARRGLVASEFSGGIDSSLVRARCIARIGTRYQGGITCKFPYAEFAREGEMQRAVLKHNPGPITTIDYRSFLPFAELARVPWHSSPNLASTAWGTFSSGAWAAQRIGAQFLLSGHGGDTLFRIHPEKKVEYQLPPDISRWLPPALYQEVSDRAEHIAMDLNAPGADEGFGGIWHPGLFDAYQPAALLRSGVPGIHYVSGLVSRDVLRAAAQLWLLDPPRNEQMQKAFANSVFGDDLPDSLWQRPGKVDHLGIVYRGAIAAREEIMEIVGQSKELFDALGISKRRLSAFADAATRGVDSGNPMFSIMLAISLWANQTKPNPTIRRGEQFNLELVTEEGEPIGSHN